jgi:hypothetical protein
MRMKIRLDLHQVLLRGLYTGMANSWPGGAQAYRARFEDLRKEHSKIAIPGLPPEYSDMLAAEYQEALDDILKDIESGFRA